MKKKINIRPYDYLVLILLVLFFIGYFGLFSLLVKYVSKIVIYLIVLFIWIIVMKKYIKHGIKNFKKEYINDALSIVTLIIVTSSVLFLFLNKSTNINSQSNETVSLMLFSTLIFTPIVEELVNRCAIGLLLEKFTSKNNYINIITTIIFVFMHIYKMNLNIVSLLIYSVIYFLLGYACGYYYRKTNNIILSILIHFLWNLFMIIGVVIRNTL